ncbi:hypothetical protein B566_EDAN018357 [Ephemera danica]|nr:hypothetical protein B566_EDAN018357 [Ephemera danica]
MGNEALNAGFGVLRDAINQKPMNESLKKRMREAGSNLMEKAERKIDSMSGRGYFAGDTPMQGIVIAQEVYLTTRTFAGRRILQVEQMESPTNKKFDTKRQIVCLSEMSFRNLQRYQDCVDHAVKRAVSYQNELQTLFHRVLNYLEEKCIGTNLFAQYVWRAQLIVLFYLVGTLYSAQTARPC